MHHGPADRAVGALKRAAADAVTPGVNEEGDGEDGTNSGFVAENLRKSFFFRTK